jgi:hypothetical protein
LTGAPWGIPWPKTAGSTASAQMQKPKVIRWKYFLMFILEFSFTADFR